MRCRGYPAEVYAMYALDLLEGAEAAELDLHLQECGDCGAEVRAALEALALIGAGAEPLQPPRWLRHWITEPGV